jgi:hypothetical protein
MECFLVETFGQCTIPNRRPAWLAAFTDKKIANTEPDSVSRSSKSMYSISETSIRLHWTFLFRK